MRAELQCRSFSGEPDREIHVLAVSRPDALVRPAAQTMLPDAVRQVVPENLPVHGWNLLWYETPWMTWEHPHCRAAVRVWTGTTDDEVGLYQLPWSLFQEDLTGRGGSLCHAALAVRDGQGFLFTAPADGGKTTTVNRLPDDWTVLGDDTCMVWRDTMRPSMPWRVSPLPSWGSLLGKSAKPARVGRWRVGEPQKLSGVIALLKESVDSLTQLEPSRAARPIYLSLLEHPEVNATQATTRVYAFKMACELARTTTARQLELTPGADLLTLLRGME